MESAHYHKIAKRTFERLWDTLSDYDRETIASDLDKVTELAKWFYNTVALAAKAKYESETYWMNDPASFKHPKYEN